MHARALRPIRNGPRNYRACRHRPALRTPGSAGRHRPGSRSPRRRPCGCWACRDGGRRRPSPAGRHAPANRRAASPPPPPPVPRNGDPPRTSRQSGSPGSRATACRRPASRSASPPAAAPQPLRGRPTAHRVPPRSRRRLPAFLPRGSNPWSKPQKRTPYATHSPSHSSANVAEMTRVVRVESSDHLCPSLPQAGDSCHMTRTPNPMLPRFMRHCREVANCNIDQAGVHSGSVRGD